MTTATGGNTTGRLKSQVLQGPMKSVTSSVEARFASAAMTPTSHNVRLHKAQAWSRTSASGVQNALTTYNPELERFWVRAPTTRVSTLNSRREWFRVMHFNVMTDTFTHHEDHDGTAFQHTSPITDVKVKVPKSKLRRGRFGEEVPEEGELEYPSDTNFMHWNHRLKRLMDEILYYDPDVITMNEVTRAQFQGSLWRATRLAGYGGTFVSGRRGKQVLNLGEWYGCEGHEDKIPWEEDVGNAVFWHKGRFFAQFMPGAEVAKLPFCNITGLRDRSTGCQLLTCNVHLHAGTGKAAVAKREYEIKQLLTGIEWTRTRTTEAPSQCLYVVGDFNVEQEDEPCVTMLREKLHSAYDVCGGPRWTTWHHQEPPKPEEPSKKNETEAAATSSSAKDEKLDAKASEGKKEAAAATSDATDVVDAAANGVDETALTFDEERALQLQRGIHKRTTDFMLFDPNRCSVLQTLDIPADNLIPQDTLLPHPRHPFHHMHLVADLCWNDFGAVKLSFD